MANVRVNWAARSPTQLESLLFLALMSGPPKFRGRDPTASLTGAIDLVALVQIAVWLCGGLWVFARLYPALHRRGTIPVVNRVLVIGGLFIAALSLSIWRSPGVLLTGFMLGQIAVMLSFSLMFVTRFGPSTYLRHMFACVFMLTLMMIAAAFLAPELVLVQSRFRGEQIAPTGPVAAMALVFCLSNVPRLRSALFWPALAFFGVLLAASRTRTAYAAFLVFLAVGFIAGKGLRVRKLVPLLAGLTLSLFLLDALTRTTDYVVRDTATVQTMSDRVPLWEHLTKTVMREEPLIGLGYYAASRVLAPQYNSSLGNAHSAFFEVLLGGGLVGAFGYLVLCVSLLWYAGRVLHVASGQPNAVATVGLLSVVLIQGITSSEALNAGPIGFTFWSLTALLPALYRESVSQTVFYTQRLARRRPVTARVQPVTARRSFS